jgi:hypothetical protein
MTDSGFNPTRSLYTKKEVDELLSSQRTDFIQKVEALRQEHGTYCGGWHDMGNFEEDLCTDCEAVRNYKKLVLELLKGNDHE